MTTMEWTQDCTDAVKEYNQQLKEAGDTSKPLNVFEYLKWLNESDPTVMDYLPKRSE
jgi:hypothetical protein